MEAKGIDKLSAKLINYYRDLYTLDTRVTLINHHASGIPVGYID